MHSAGKPSGPSSLVGHQAFLAHSQAWWDPTGPYAILHQLTPLRLSWIQEVKTRTYGNPALQGKKLLDVGCGGGLLSEALARQGARVTGLDTLEENILAARNHQRASEKLPLTYYPLSLSSFAKKHAGEKFDVVTALEVIEHTPSPLAFLKDIDSLLKPGGLCILSTLDRTFLSYVQAIPLGEHILRWLPKGTHDWKFFLTPSELKMMGGALGWAHIETQNISLTPWTGQWKQTPKRTTNFFIAFQRLP